MPSIMTQTTVNQLIFDILFDYVTLQVHRASASRYRSRVAIMLTRNIRRGYIRARKKKIASSEEEEEEERASHGTDLAGSLARPRICKQWRLSARRVLSMTARYVSHLHIIAIIR